MKSNKKILYISITAVILFLLSYFAWIFPFYEFETNNYDADLIDFLSLEYFKTLIPLGIIMILSLVGIIAITVIRKRIFKQSSDKAYRISARVDNRGKGTLRSPAPFMVIRWLIMIGFSTFIIFGSLSYGLRAATFSIPLLSCPWMSSEMAGSGCYLLSHLDELFALPIKNILIFIISTLGFTIVLGRAICGFLCPMGLIQDIMDKLRKVTKNERLVINEKMYKALSPIRWVMVFIFMGLVFIGGNFCNFCPAVSVTPILAGFSTSIYASGFMMIFVLIGGFFKHRLWCNICPVGYLIGLFHKISFFRIKKDCTSCTECGACYEACPMGIKTIYTERENPDVTDINCVMCGECIRKCPENNALSMTFMGLPIYKASRKALMSGYKKGIDNNESN